MKAQSRDANGFEVWLPGGEAIAMEADKDGFVPGLPFENPPQPGQQSPALEPEGPDPQQIMDEAEDEAQNIISHAHAEAENIKQQAQEEMDRQIKQRVEQEAQTVRREQTRAFEDAAADLVAQFEAAMDNQLHCLERRVAELVAGIVEKVISQKVAADDEIVLDVTREALRQLDDAQSLTVMVHPDDEQTLNEHHERLLEVAGRLESIEIATNTDIQPGGCLLDSDAGEVDARIQSQLNAILDAISCGSAQRTR